MLVGEELDLRLERAVAALEPGNLPLAPGNAAVGLQRNCVVACGGKRGSAGGKLVRQHLDRGVARGAAMNAVAARVRGEAESVEAADIMILHQDAAVGSDLCHQLFLVA